MIPDVKQPVKVDGKDKLPKETIEKTLTMEFQSDSFHDRCHVGARCHLTGESIMQMAPIDAWNNQQIAHTLLCTGVGHVVQ